MAVSLGLSLVGDSYPEFPDTHPAWGPRLAGALGAAVAAAGLAGRVHQLQPLVAPHAFSDDGGVWVIERIGDVEPSAQMPAPRRRWRRAPTRLVDLRRFSSEVLTAAGNDLVHEVAGQLVVLAQRIGNGQQRTAVLEQHARRLVGGLVHDLVGLDPRALVGQHLGGDVAGHVHLGGLEAQQAVAGADHADQLRGDVGGSRQIRGDARRGLAVLLDLGSPPGECDDDEIAHLRWRAQVPFLAVVVSHETERCSSDAGSTRRERRDRRARR